MFSDIDSSSNSEELTLTKFVELLAGLETSTPATAIRHDMNAFSVQEIVARLERWQGTSENSSVLSQTKQLGLVAS